MQIGEYPCQGLLDNLEFALSRAAMSLWMADIWFCFREGNSFKKFSHGPVLLYVTFNIDRVHFEMPLLIGIMASSKKMLMSLSYGIEFQLEVESGRGGAYSEYLRVVSFRSLERVNT